MGYFNRLQFFINFIKASGVLDKLNVPEGESAFDHLYEAGIHVKASYMKLNEAFIFPIYDITKIIVELFIVDENSISNYTCGKFTYGLDIFKPLHSNDKIFSPPTLYYQYHIKFEDKLLFKKYITEFSKFLTNKVFHLANLDNYMSKYFLDLGVEDKIYLGHGSKKFKEMVESFKYLDSWRHYNEKVLSNEEKQIILDL
jgi:hypothetical protein